MNDEGSIAIISTILFFVIPFLYILLSGKKKCHKYKDDDDTYKFGASLDYCDPNDPSSHHYTGDRPG